MKRFFLLSIFMFFLNANLFADDRATGAQFKVEEKGDKTKSEYETTVIESKRLKDSDKVGSYNQPVWTTKRRFPTTRVYVLPENRVQFEYWLLMEGNLGGDSDPKYTGIYEIEFGLGQRLMGDFYLKTIQNGSSSPIDILSQSIELRYAFFDWGRVFGNPTVYMEWIRQSDKPQKGEVKILLGDEINSRLFWGLNIAFEREFGSKTANEYGLSGGIAYSIIDGYLSTGIEMKVAAEDEQGSRFDFLEKKFLIGPSLLYKPIPVVNLILTPLFGVKMEKENGEEESKGIYAIYYILGVDL